MNRKEIKELKRFLNLHHALDREILRNVKEGTLSVRYVRLSALESSNDFKVD